MPPEIAKLGHVALETPDLEESLWFFRDIVGLHEVERVDDTVFLRSNRDWEHHSLSLTQGQQSTVDHIGWRTQRPEDVQAFAEALNEEGTEVEEISPNTERGQGEAIRFPVPGGYTFELYHDVEKPEPSEDKKSRLKNRLYNPSSGGVITPQRVDHVNIWGANAPKTQDWLEENLGFRMNEYIKLNNGSRFGGWMSVSPLVHDIAVMADPKEQPGRFHHVAYYFDDVHDLRRAADYFREHNIPIDAGPGKHGITQAHFLYVRDPASGHRIELFSGGYLIFDPDWEAIEWSEEEMDESLIWYGGGKTPMELTEEMQHTTGYN